LASRKLTIERRLTDHSCAGPSGVCAQSNARISRAISLSPGKMRSRSDWRPERVIRVVVVFLALVTLLVGLVGLLVSLRLLIIGLPCDDARSSWLLLYAK
jgi:hypothetical protein